jgi:hypothetical protein
MKACSVGLAAHLQQGQTTVTTLFSITRRDGTVLGFTEHDQDLVFGGVTYLSTSSYNRFNLNETSDGESKSTELVGAIAPPSSPVVPYRHHPSGPRSAAVRLRCKSRYCWSTGPILHMGAIILGTGSWAHVTLEEYQFRVEVRGLGYQTE